MVQGHRSSPTGEVVVGIDGSDASKEALHWADREAELRELPLMVVMTWDYPVTTGMAIGWPDDLDFSALAQQVLDETIQAELGTMEGRRFTSRLLQGHAAIVLEDLSHSAALVVVGSRGHGGFAGMLLGSVSEHLAAHAHCPVMIVHGAQDTSPAVQP